MSQFEVTRDMVIADVLGACASVVIPSGPGRWKVKRGRSCGVDACLDDGWLTFRAPLLLRAHNAWHLAAANAALAGRSRLAFGATATTPYLTADIAIDAAGDLESECRRIVSDLLTARKQLRGTTGKSDNDTPPDVEDRDVLRALGERCQETDWSHGEREKGPLMVNLNVPSGFYQAALNAASERDIRASVTLARLDSISDVSRIALATLTLTANRIIRLARGAVEETGAGARCFFEVRFSELPSAAGLDCALGALSAASSLLGKALPCLADEQVGRRFLAVRGIDPARPPFSLRGVVTQTP